MRKLKSCGFIVTRGNPLQEFLLMIHKDRLDLPKGHVDGNETEIECALRELAEETAIRKEDIEIDPEFRFATTYQVRPKKFKGEICEKTIIIYHAYLVRDVAIQVTEHPDYEWRPWDPPHRIQPETIDPLLERLERHLEREAEG